MLVSGRSFGAFRVPLLVSIRSVGAFGTPLAEWEVKKLLDAPETIKSAIKVSLS
jgi:hypothetical protein